MTARRLHAVAAPMPEDGPEGVEWHLRRYLRDLRGLHGVLLAYHPWKLHAKRAADGWPDWVITGPGGLLVRELKREGKEPSAAQRQWLDFMAAAGLDAGVWRPSAVASGEMVHELRRIAGLGGAR